MAYLENGSLEATARALFVHPNTVRYRLGKFEQDSGYDITDSRDAFAVRLGAMYAVLPSPSERR
ncbi:helix-turn-helix domain-containing protein [Yimella sp. NH-Cas1]|nr:helix-turn-helix domain-containing protein [Yimella sp. NH-Cas1]MCG8655033.1 helix-turn-helix domain-containing protein [Yimella sp. NH-Cas1]